VELPSFSMQAIWVHGLRIQEEALSINPLQSPFGIYQSKIVSCPKAQIAMSRKQFVKTISMTPVPIANPNKIPRSIPSFLIRV